VTIIEILLTALAVVGVSALMNYFWPSRRGNFWQNTLITTGTVLIGLSVSQYFFPPKGKAPEGTAAAQLCPPAERPLNREVDFVDAKQRKAPVETEVETTWGQLTFTTNGAVLDRIGFRRTVNGHERMSYTISPAGQYEREDRCFLVAFDQETPYHYEFVDRRDGEEDVQLTYEARSSRATVRKIYAISKKLCTVDLTLEVEPRGDATLTPRLFFPSPIVPGCSIGGDQSRSSLFGGPPPDPTVLFVMNGASTKKLSGTALAENTCSWPLPEVFGTDGRYFIHALVKDPTKFAQRAYTGPANRCAVTSILEGPAVTEATRWQLSFYMGPKEERAFMPVEPRFDQLLGYYWILAPLSKLLLRILNLLYDYVHNYGWAILLLTLLIKLLMLPFSIRADRSMKQRGELEKKLNYIQQKYKHDRARLEQERAEFIRKHGIPGMGGCLPMLLQLPIFVALNSVLSVALELHQAPFLWIPDLSAADPYYILPAILVGGMLLQSLTVDQKNRFSMVATAVIFGAFSVNFASGLILYIAANSVLSVAQTKVLQLLRIVK